MVEVVVWDPKLKYLKLDCLLFSSEYYTVLKTSDSGYLSDYPRDIYKETGTAFFYHLGVLFYN